MSLSENDISSAFEFVIGSLPQLIERERSEPDEIGKNCRTGKRRGRKATITAGQILQSLDGKLQPGGDWRMEVTDEFGHPLHAVAVCRG